jgi:cell division protein FtsB
MLALGIWLCFFDRNDLFTQLDLRAKVNELEKDRNYYQKEIQRNKNEMIELQTNTKNLEKFAREKYLMKKDNEDVFVIVRQ